MLTTAQTEFGTTSGSNVNNSTNRIWNYQRFQCQQQHKQNLELPAVPMLTTAQTEFGTTSGYNVKKSTNRIWNYQRFQSQQQHKQNP